MLKSLIVCVLIGLVYADKVNSHPFPSDIQKCHRGDNQCIQNAIYYIANNYPQGYPALNLPSIDPLRWKKFHALRLRENDENDEDRKKLSIDWKAKNIEITGFSKSNFTVKGFENDIGTSNVTIKIEMPIFKSAGDHQLMLRFKNHHSHGKGHFELDYENADMIFNFIPTTYTKDGKEYIKIHNVSAHFIVRKANIDFGNLFDGDKKLSEKEHKYLNDNSNDFYEQVKIFVDSEWGLIFTQIFGLVVEKFPVNEMFLD